MFIVVAVCINRKKWPIFVFFYYLLLVFCCCCNILWPYHQTTTNNSVNKHGLQIHLRVCQFFLFNRKKNYQKQNETQKNEFTFAPHTLLAHKLGKLFANFFFFLFKLWWWLYDNMHCPYWLGHICTCIQRKKTFR